MDGHGTHVAGTVLQETNNNLALAGIAHRARLLPLKACVGYWEIQFTLSARGVRGFLNPDNDGFCDTAAASQALRFAADNGAQIANLSLGGPGQSQASLEVTMRSVDIAGDGASAWRADASRRTRERASRISGTTRPPTSRRAAMTYAKARPGRSSSAG